MSNNNCNLQMINMDNNDDTAISSYIEGKRILVTGGAGSIGREIVKTLLKYNPLAVRVFDNNETALNDLTLSLNSKILRPLYGNISDQGRLELALDDVDIVFHTAALKHVPVCEFNPFEAVKTNVIGTQNVITASIRQNVDKFILISTDKAVNPYSIMGTTKLLAERLTLTSNNYRGNKRTKLFCVRFGNVVNSRGSIIPLFLEQIKKGGPVTVTDPEMTRFIMTIPEAVSFILKSTILGHGGEIFIKKMSSLRISDLAKTMVNYYGSEFGFKPDEIQIKIIGKRPGEKLHEILIDDEEADHTYESDDLYVIIPQNHLQLENPALTDLIENFTKVSECNLCSNQVILLEDKEIINCIEGKHYG